MQIISPTNEINYGSYDDSLDWNVQQTWVNKANGKKKVALPKCLRINVFTPKIQAEIEFLCSDNTVRILLIGYDLEHDLYLEKTWLLTSKQFSWEGSPIEYQIMGRALGLKLELNCNFEGHIEAEFSYFNHYHLQFSADIQRSQRKSLRNVNPHDMDHWSYSEKHAMLNCRNLELMLDGNSYTPVDFNLSYEWFGGQLPEVTRELRSAFWQSTAKVNLKSFQEERTSALFSSGRINLREQMSSQEQQEKRQCMAGSLLLMGHDSCSSESAIWVTDKVRYRLPRIIPSFSRSVLASLLPDLEWKMNAGEHLSLCFCPFGVSDAPQLVFPHTKMQRIYGLFYGKLQLMPIQGAVGYIDYREICWGKAKA